MSDEALIRPLPWTMATFDYRSLHQADDHFFKRLQATLDAGQDIHATLRFEPPSHDYVATALHRAAMWDRGPNHPCLAWLLERGASAQALDSEGATPLHLAARHGHVHACRMLVAAGAPLEGLDRTGATPLLAAFDGLKGEGLCSETEARHVVAWLLDHGANPRHVTTQGTSLAHYAAQYLTLDDVVAFVELGAPTGPEQFLLFSPHETDLRTMVCHDALIVHLLKQCRMHERDLLHVPGLLRLFSLGVVPLEHDNPEFESLMEASPSYEQALRLWQSQRLDQAWTDLDPQADRRLSERF
jgi:hypothetical protein